jgi:L-galactono-1,4-lactone dehydrogenase
LRLHVWRPARVGSKWAVREVARARARRFFEYCQLLQDELMPRYGATEHWAKIEAHRLDPEAARARLAARFPVDRFNAARAALDPKNIMANDVINVLFPLETVHA